MKLWEFSGKDVKIVDIDGRTFTGNVDHYTSELDPNGIASISLAPDDRSDILINFEESEIARIECTSVPSREPAIAV